MTNGAKHATTYYCSAYYILILTFKMSQIQSRARTLVVVVIKFIVLIKLYGL